MYSVYLVKESVSGEAVGRDPIQIPRLDIHCTSRKPNLITNLSYFKYIHTFFVLSGITLFLFSCKSPGEKTAKRRFVPGLGKVA